MLEEKLRTPEYMFCILVLVISLFSNTINRNVSMQLLLMPLLTLLLFVLVKKYNYNNYYKVKIIIIYGVVVVGLMYLFKYQDGYYEYFLKEALYIVYLILLLWIFQVLFSKSSLSYRLLNFIVAVGSVVSVYCFFEYIIQKNIFFSNYFDYKNIIGGFNPYYRVSGTFFHPIPMSTFSSGMIYISYYLMLNKKNKIYLFLILLNLGATLITFSRSTLIAVFVSILVYNCLLVYFLIKTKKNIFILNILKKYIYCFIGISLLFLTINNIRIGNLTIFELIKNRFMEVFSVQGDGSFYQRYYGISYVIDSMLNKSNIFVFLLGHGFGRLDFDLKVSSTTIYGENFYLIDNEYFTLFYNIGFLGIIFVIIGVLFLIFKHLKRINYSGNIKADLISLSFFISLLISVFFYEGLTYISTVFILALSIGLCSKAIAKSNNKFESRN
ncbi:hypothetical protein BpJC7_16860 [Weizmannia acidilactici]|uniref:O-antigen polymerase n=1 Tax=Weizmannia acidilactici TaxID=2607726 RepID=A0A5J4JE64_9BACI|nr:O-antigen polymerase [Weizmannia acidilactici]NWN97482.1 oligosaccharide repeat unit polymerase [Bacillus sp. (in: firmicutes)]GER70383.1 hypothetical protein BpJC7_16860 [Weizmannia acidilactici]